MPARKSPDRARFLAGLEPLKEPGMLPPTYSNLVYAKIRRPATWTKVKDPAVRNKLCDRKAAGVYFNQVVKGQTVDFVVLGCLEEVSQEYIATLEPAEA
jgi:hypothetical protein